MANENNPPLHHFPTMGEINQLTLERDACLKRLGENDEEIKLLRDALAEFGQHKASCEHNDFESPMCTCGLAKVLSSPITR
jgi:hypothetical protein